MGLLSLSLIGGFFKTLVERSVLFIYLLALITGGVLFFHIFPAYEILIGLLNLAGTNALSSVVSFSQWAVSPGMLGNTLTFIFVAPLPASLLFSLLFAGTLGAFAKGAGLSAGFPAKIGMNFWNGYRRRFIQMTLLFYAAFTLLLTLLLVWVISAIPLAVINELAGSGVLQPAILNAVLAVTALVVYAGLMFLRIYPTAFLPALYSGSQRPFGAAFSFAGRNFFKVSKYFLISDAIVVLLILLYDYMNKGIYALLLNCFVSALLVFFLLYAVFTAYAADGYGFDELDAEEDSADIYDEAEDYIMPYGEDVYERNYRLDTGTENAYASIGGFEEVRKDAE